MARILVVDDEEAVRATLKLVLEKLGHSVSTASNGNEALKRARAEAYDVVLTDIIMPEKEGIELILELRKSTAGRMRIIAMSGGGRSRNLSLLKVAEGFGADAALSKPVSKDALSECLRKLGL